MMQAIPAAAIVPTMRCKQLFPVHRCCRQFLQKRHSRHSLTRYSRDQNNRETFTWRYWPEHPHCFVDRDTKPFSDWLEEKIDLPIFEELPVGVNGVGSGTDATAIGLKHQQSQHTHPQQQQQHLHHHPHILQHFVPPAPVEQHTPVLLPEFDYVLNSNEIATLPERPQREEDMVLTMLQEMQPHELDELVRMRVESLVESPDSCVESSRSSSQEESESGAASPSSDSGYDDPDWTPEPLEDFTPTKRRRTTKPYSRTPPEEKRQRKKEQNKNAATRYRLKKKAEIEEILSEEKGLIATNEKLKTDLSELAREIKYLKSLMRDVFKAKGLLK